MKLKKKRILAVASIGGHWIQLLRVVKPLEAEYDVVYMSTHKKCSAMVSENRFYRLVDFNRRNAWKMLASLFMVLWVLLKERPNTIITTGAAPGLLVVFIARIFFRKTIWLDSIANVKKLSACGCVAKRIAGLTYTQWPDLAENGVFYAGNIFGVKEGEKK